MRSILAARFRATFLCSFLLIALTGCSESNQPSSNSTHEFNLPTQIRTAKKILPSDIQARVKLGDDITYQLTVSNLNASTTLTGIAAGPHSFTIEFYYLQAGSGEIILAEAKETLNVVAGKQTQLEFSETDYIYPDRDQDRISNLQELTQNWDPLDSNHPAAAFAAKCFLLGSDPSDDERETDERLHEVCPAAFSIGAHEVTKGEFSRFVTATGYVTDAEKNSGELQGCEIDDGSGNFNYVTDASWRNPGFVQLDSHPAVCISWYDANAYTAWLSEITGMNFRLPTEAEWEYSARADSTFRYGFGNDAMQLCNYGNVADLDAASVYEGWPESDRTNCHDGHVYTASIGQYPANSAGLYDTLGNVREWTCSDYDENYEGKELQCMTTGNSTDWPAIRGGSWSGSAFDQRLANRKSLNPFSRQDNLGFRIALDPAQ